MAKGRARPNNEINSGSMADIAFLLLIFFLVVTEMKTERGIPIKLPAWSEEPPEEVTVQDRNAFVVLLNSRDELLVEGETTKITQLKNKAKEFIDNKDRDKRMSVNPQVAVVSFKGNRGSSYEMYIAVYNELRAAYNELRDELALRQFGKPLKDFVAADSLAMQYIRQEYPYRISEADPVDY